MVWIFALARLDVLPVEDLGIWSGMAVLYGDVSHADMFEIATAWQPHRSTASLYLWRAAD